MSRVPKMNWDRVRRERSLRTNPRGPSDLDGYQRLVLGDLWADPAVPRGSPPISAEEGDLAIAALFGWRLERGLGVPLSAVEYLGLCDECLGAGDDGRGGVCPLCNGEGFPWPEDEGDLSALEELPFLRRIALSQDLHAALLARPGRRAQPDALARSVQVHPEVVEAQLRELVGAQAAVALDTGGALGPEFVAVEPPALDALGAVPTGGRWLGAYEMSRGSGARAGLLLRELDLLEEQGVVERREVDDLAAFRTATSFREALANQVAEAFSEPAVTLTVRTIARRVGVASNHIDEVLRALCDEDRVLRVSARAYRPGPSLQADLERTEQDQAAERRERAVALLQKEPQSRRQLAAALALSKAEVSELLRILKEEGINIVAVPNGGWVIAPE